MGNPPNRSTKGGDGDIDIVLREPETDRSIAVLDTKYKRHKRPEESDIQQVVAYAVEMGTKKAFLVYPTREIESIHIPVGDQRVRSLAFDVSDDPDRAGSLFLAELAASLE